MGIVRNPRNKRRAGDAPNEQTPDEASTRRTQTWTGGQVSRAAQKENTTRCLCTTPSSLHPSLTSTTWASDVTAHLEPGAISKRGEKKLSKRPRTAALLHPPAAIPPAVPATITAAVTAAVAATPRPLTAAAAAVPAAAVVAAAPAPL